MEKQSQVKNSDVRGAILKALSMGVLGGGAIAGYKYLRDTLSDIKWKKDRERVSKDTVVIPQIKQAAGEGWPIWLGGPTAAGSAQAILGSAIALPAGALGMIKLYDMFREKQLKSQAAMSREEYENTLREVIHPKKEKKAQFLPIGPDKPGQNTLDTKSYKFWIGGALSAWATTLALVAAATKKRLDKGYNEANRGANIRSPIRAPRIMLKDYSKIDKAPELLEPGTDKDPGNTTRKKKASAEIEVTPQDVRVIVAIESLARTKTAGFLEGTELGEEVKKGNTPNYSDLIKSARWEELKEPFNSPEMGVEEYMYAIWGDDK